MPILKPSLALLALGLLAGGTPAQAQRVALRKVRVSDGRLQLFSRLHERNGTYTAGTREGAGNDSAVAQW